MADGGAVACCGAPSAPPANPAAGWDGMAGWYTRWMSPGTAAVASALFGHAGLLSPDAPRLRVLETHCGDARAAAGLLPSPAVAEYTCVDFSAGMLAAARANLGERAAVVSATSCSLPFDDGAFDAYVANLGLCCTPDLTATLSEARRVLAPGGVAAMSLRIEGGEGDTSLKLLQDALAPFGMPPGPDREGVKIGKDLPALKARVAAAGFEGGAVAFRTYATLPVHDVPTFLEFATQQPPTFKFLAGLEASQRDAAEKALAEAAAAALAAGAIQMAVAVVIARC